MSVTAAPVPVVTLISNEIFTRLQALVTADVSAYTFADVVRPTKLATYTPRNGLIVLTRGDVARLPEMDCPGNPPSVAIEQTFLIRIHIAPSEHDTTPVDLYEDAVEAEIHRALTNHTTWHTFGGYAINSRIEATVTVTSDGGYDGIAIPVIVVYRTDEGNPYTVRA